MADDASWTLLDAAEHAAANGRTFFIPDPAERGGLQPGDRAKLLFTVDTPDSTELAVAGERMWVEVTDRAPGGYVGRLANDPVVVTGLARGARIEFEPRHVIQVPTDEPDPWEGLAAFASERLFDDDDPGVGVATFEPGDAGTEVANGDITLSGWMLLAGDETAGDVDDPSRIRMPGLSWLVRRHPELRALFDDHDGAAGSWVRDGGDWRRA